MRRYALRDDQWDRIKDILPGREGHVGVTAKDNRLFVEAVLYRYRAGIPWRDLPERFGDPIKIHTRFSRWAKSGAWKKIFERLAADADNEYAMVDALGNPLAFFLTAGQAHDLQGADVLLPQMQADTLLADKAFDADERVIEPLLAAGKKFVIPPKSNRKVQRLYDKELYKARHLMENFYCKLKQYRAIATRYDKTARNFLGAIHLAAAVIWLN